MAPVGRSARLGLCVTRFFSPRPTAAAREKEDGRGLEGGGEGGGEEEEREKGEGGGAMKEVVVEEEGVVALVVGSERRGSRGRWSSSETTRGAGLDPRLSPSPRNGGKPKQPQSSLVLMAVFTKTNGNFESDRLNSRNSALCELRWYLRQVYTGAVSNRRHAERNMASVGSPRACDTVLRWYDRPLMVWRVARAAVEGG